MGDLTEKAKSKGVKLFIINCEPGQSFPTLKDYAKAVGAESVAHYQCVAKPNFTKYFPYHVVAKDGKITMSGGYDMSARKWKDWEGLSGLK